MLHPGEIVTTRPAEYLDGSLEKITNLSPWRSWETERSMISGGAIEHRPTYAHLIENVAIAGAHTYCGSAKEHRGYGQESLFLDFEDRNRIFDEASLVTTNYGSHYFGTYLQYDFPLALLPENGATLISMTTKPFEHGKEYWSLCQLPGTDLVRTGIVRKLTTYTDNSENASKAQRYVKLRSALRVTVGTKRRHKTAPGVFIRRGTTGELRLLENEREIETKLTELGFHIVDPETHSAREIVDLSLDAKVVIGVEGSQLSHAIFTIADGGSFLVLQPPHRFSTTYKEYTDRLDMRFAFVVGARSASGFTIDFDDVKAMLDRLL